MDKDDYYRSYPGRLVLKETFIAAKYNSACMKHVYLQIASIVHALIPISINLAMDLWHKSDNDF